MKYAKKFMVVPYIKLQEDPEQKHLSDLDRDIGDILTNNELPTDTKVKLYNIALQKYQKNSKSTTKFNNNESIQKINEQMNSYISELKKEKTEKNDELFNQSMEESTFNFLN